MRILKTTALFGTSLLLASTPNSVQAFRSSSNDADDLTVWDSEQDTSYFRSLSEFSVPTFVSALGGPRVDQVYAAKQTQDGGYIATGYTFSYGSGGSDALMVKLNKTGAVSWAKALGGSADDGGYSIQETRDGGYVMAGYTSSYGSRYYDDALIVKLDEIGAVSWAKVLGGSSGSRGYSIQQTQDGGYIMAGYTSTYRGLVVKLNETGAVSWAKTLGGSLYERVYSIQQTQDGGYIMTGYTSSYGSGSSDALVVRLNKTGAVSWAKVLGGSSYERGYSIQQTQDGGYIMTGYTSSYGSGSSDALVVRLNETGAVSWAKVLGGSADDGGCSIQQTQDGGYIMTGYTNSYGSGSSDALVVRLNKTGAANWAKILGGPSAELGYSIQQTQDGGYVTAAVRADSTGINGLNKFNAYSYLTNEDALVIKMDENGDTPGCGYGQDVTVTEITISNKLSSSDISGLDSSISIANDWVDIATKSIGGNEISLFLPAICYTLQIAVGVSVGLVGLIAIIVVACSVSIKKASDSSAFKKAAEVVFSALSCLTVDLEQLRVNLVNVRTVYLNHRIPEKMLLAFIASLSGKLRSNANLDGATRARIGDMVQETFSYLTSTTVDRSIGQLNMELGTYLSGEAVSKGSNLFQVMETLQQEAFDGTHIVQQVMLNENFNALQKALLISTVLYLACQRGVKLEVEPAYSECLLADPMQLMIGIVLITCYQRQVLKATVPSLRSALVNFIEGIEKTLLPKQEQAVIGLVQLMQWSGMSINKVIQERRLFSLVCEKTTNPAFLKTMINLGFDPNIKDDMSVLPLHRCLKSLMVADGKEGEMSESNKRTVFQILRLMTDTQMRSKPCDENGNGLLHLACLVTTDVSFLQKLVQLGVDPSIVNGDKMYPGELATDARVKHFFRQTLQPQFSTRVSSGGGGGSKEDDGVEMVVYVPRSSDPEQEKCTMDDIGLAELTGGMSTAGNGETGLLVGGSVKSVLSVCNSGIFAACSDLIDRQSLTPPDNFLLAVNGLFLNPDKPKNQIYATGVRLLLCVYVSRDEAEYRLLEKLVLKNLGLTYQHGIASQVLMSIFQQRPQQLMEARLPEVNPEYSAGGGGL